MPGDSEIEIRPLFEAADFGAEFTPELQAREAVSYTHLTLPTSDLV